MFWYFKKVLLMLIHLDIQNPSFFVTAGLIYFVKVSIETFTFSVVSSIEKSFILIFASKFW